MPQRHQIAESRRDDLDLHNGLQFISRDSKRVHMCNNKLINSADLLKGEIVSDYLNLL